MKKGQYDIPVLKWKIFFRNLCNILQIRYLKNPNRPSVTAVSFRKLVTRA